MWECACGEGHLSKALESFGYNVYSSDVKNRGYGQIKDFLLTTAAPIEGDFDIITNPPYKYALEFVQKALELLPVGGCAYMFLKLTFCEGKKRYEQLFKQNNPKAIYCFSERVMCAKNGEFQRMKDGGGSAVAYAWFVWEKGYKGKTILEWI